VEHDWPGNVRQLENALTNAAVMAEGAAVDLDDLATPLGTALEAARPSPTVAKQGRRKRERESILEALEACGWNKTRAARELGMPRRTLYRRLVEYDIG
jgi:transcriptional regulator of acetoin/glycerol metabolism